jgi:hypothetical protein
LFNLDIEDVDTLEILNRPEPVYSSGEEDLQPIPPLGAGPPRIIPQVDLPDVDSNESDGEQEEGEEPFLYYSGQFYSRINKNS